MSNSHARNARRIAQLAEDLARDLETEPRTVWQIPATFTAEITGGVETPAQVRFTVSPSESYAGYFGPPSGVVDHHPGEYDGPGPDHDLWPIVAAYLTHTGGQVIAGWEE